MQTCVNQGHTDASFGTVPAQVIVKRGQPIEGPPGPIVVATRNDALQGVLDATPADRREGICTCHPTVFNVLNVGPADVTNPMC